MNRAHEIAAAVRSGKVRAADVIAQTLATLRARDRSINAFTDVLELRALTAAANIDAQVASGRDPGHTPSAAAARTCRPLRAAGVGGVPSASGSRSATGRTARV